MQRRATSNTRGPNADERRFQAWLKDQPCAYCGYPGPSIVDHARGSSYKHLKTLIGHIFCTSKCQTCDDYKTHGNHRRHYEETGKLESTAWLEQVSAYNGQTGAIVDTRAYNAMMNFNQYERRMYT